VLKRPNGGLGGDWTWAERGKTGVEGDGTEVAERSDTARGTGLRVHRSATSRPGALDLSRDLDQLFVGRATNVFMVKVNYWLGR